MVQYRRYYFWMLHRVNTVLKCKPWEDCRGHPMKQLLCNDSTGHIKDTTNKCAKPRGRNAYVLRFTRRRLLCAGALGPSVVCSQRRSKAQVADGGGAR